MAYKSFSQFILASGDSETNYSYFMVSVALFSYLGLWSALPN